MRHLLRWLLDVLRFWLAGAVIALWVVGTLLLILLLLDKLLPMVK